MKKIKLLGFSLLLLITFIVLIVSSTFLYLSELDNQDQDGKLINTAGRQRMLSQKITKNSIKLFYNRANQSTIETLRNDVMEFVNNHDYLLASTPSDTIQTKLKGLDYLVKIISQDSFSIINANEDSLTKKALDSVIESESEFLFRMNETVGLYELSLRRKQMNLRGSILWFSIFIILVVVFIVLFVQILLIRKNEAYNSKMREKNAELESFVYIASHDLQEPLGTITNFTSILEKKYADKLDEKGKKILSFIIGSSSRMQNLIKSLLDLSRLGLEKKKNRINCNQILDTLLVDIQAKVKESGATINYANLPNLTAYEIELYLLFQNLILNAIKYRGKKSPKIDISAKRINNFWQFTVKDNGIGIEKKDHKKIFQMYQQLHARDKYKGIGAGLAHAKKVVELHNGQIKVESELGKGSSFIFTIEIE